LSGRERGEDGEADGGLIEVGPAARQSSVVEELDREGARAWETEGERSVEVWSELGCGPLFYWLGGATVAGSTAIEGQITFNARILV
jgi:hypothetical protein